MTKLLLTAAAGALACGAANATVYTFVPNLTSGATIVGTITTDGVTGDIGFSDITGLDVTVSDGNGSAHLGFSDVINTGPLNGIPTLLHATATGLFFDFSGSPHAFVAYSLGSAVCMAAGPTPCGSIENNQLVLVNGVFHDSPVFSGLVEVAHVTGAVPEPASWAMMVGGFGLVGGAMRSRRKTAISFA